MSDNKIADLQTIFDTVVTHLRRQGMKSKDAQSCVYHGPNGLKCAAGILIPDEAYNPTMEGRSVMGLGFFRNSYSIHELNLLMSLQIIHDQHSESDWEYYFNALAERYNLSYEAPK